MVTSGATVDGEEDLRVRSYSLISVRPYLVLDRKNVCFCSSGLRFGSKR